MPIYPNKDTIHPAKPAICPTNELYEVIAYVDNGADRYKAVFYVFSDDSISAELAVQDHIDHLDSETWCPCVLSAKKIVSMPNVVFGGYDRVLKGNIKE